MPTIDQAAMRENGKRFAVGDRVDPYLGCQAFGIMVAGLFYEPAERSSSDGFMAKPLANRCSVVKVRFRSPRSMEP